MVNRSKAKGTAAESAVVAFLNANGYPLAERRTLSGAHDKGDIAGIPNVCIEVKDHRGDSLPGWIDEVTIETCNADAAVGAVWHKRRGQGSPGKWFVSLDGEMFVKLLAFAHAGGLA